MFHQYGIPAKMGEHILDFNILQLHRCIVESTPKFKTKNNPDKEIRKIWEKLEEQSKFNEKIVNMTNLLQKEYCELIVIQQSVKPSSIDTSLTDQIKTLASTCEGKDQIIKELKSCISEKNNIIYNLKEQLTNQGQIILAFKDEQSKHDQIIAALRDEHKLLCKQAQEGKLLLQESKDIIDNRSNEKHIS